MRSGGGAGENMLRRRVRMRKKFSDLGAWRLRRAALGAEPPDAGGGALRAREEEVVEKRRGVGVVVAAVFMVAVVVFRERRESRLKSPVMDVEEAILEVLKIRDAWTGCFVAFPAEE